VRPAKSAKLKPPELSEFFESTVASPSLSTEKLSWFKLQQKG
jgi:hypothetical protein